MSFAPPVLRPLKLTITVARCAACIRSMEWVVARSFGRGDEWVGNDDGGGLDGWPIMGSSSGASAERERMVRSACC